MYVLLQLFWFNTMADRQRGPWVIISDNESFLTAPASRAAHVKERAELFQVPPRSPDLNPVEMFWSHLRIRLRKMDLQDLSAGKPPVGTAGLKRRVRALIKSPEMQQIAIKCFNTLSSKCLQVKKKKGGAIRS